MILSDKNIKSADLQRLYSLILSLKEEITRLSLQVKALKSDMKGVNNNG